MKRWFFLSFFVLLIIVGIAAFNLSNPALTPLDSLIQEESAVGESDLELIEPAASVEAVEEALVEIAPAYPEPDFTTTLSSRQYAFNAPDQVMISEPQQIALVIDSTGSTDFLEELEGLPGAVRKGETLVSVTMEAELVGPAFKIEPNGRQRKTLSRLNPTRWDWKVTPEQEGSHQLEVSLYVIAPEGESVLGEEKALAERRLISVEVSTFSRITAALDQWTTLFSSITAFISALAGLLVWFGFKKRQSNSG